MPRKSKHATTDLSFLATAGGRQRWSEQHARKVVGAWKDSGLSAREFGARYGVPRKRLECWSSKLGKKDKAAAKALQFVPVAVAPVADDSGHAGLGSMELVLPRGIRLILSTDFDAPALKRLLEAVGC